MLTLLAVRHGKSKWTEEGVSDHDRSLTKRGKRESRRIGRELARRGLIPDVIVSSTAKRARRTAKLIAKGCDCDREAYLQPGLYGGGLMEHLMTLRNLPDAVQVAMVVGHNPLLEDLTLALTDEPVTLLTATVACVDLPIVSWQEASLEPLGRLRFVFRGKDVA
jgi:phosphohistidine phosphatase